MKAGLTAEEKAIQSKTKQTQADKTSTCSEKKKKNKTETAQTKLPTLLEFSFLESIAQQTQFQLTVEAINEHKANK